MTDPLSPAVLPPGIRARLVPGIDGLCMHVLEAGDPARPCLVLLHGFPELAFSWRKVMLPLAAQGFHVIAPDQRGYGRTTGWDPSYQADLSSFRLLGLVRDVLHLVRALGHRSVAGIVGHDFGAPVAAWSALVRPDIFRSVVLMSAPFGGPPELPPAPRDDAVHAALAALDPPRKHYQWYYSTPSANADMQHAPQGVHAFLRAYFHVKSADWAGNQPFPLQSWTAGELAKMPRYYIMERDRTMPETVAPEMPPAPARWLPDSELSIYSAEFSRTGFQGALNWYRLRTGADQDAELGLFAGGRINVPLLFIAGAADWGPYQVPGSLERMRAICPCFRAVHFIAGAGHWVQQEAPGPTAEILLGFLQSDAHA